MVRIIKNEEPVVTLTIEQVCLLFALSINLLLNVYSSKFLVKNNTLKFSGPLDHM